MCLWTVLVRGGVTGGDWRCGVLEILCSGRHTRILASLFTFIHGMGS